MHLSKTHTTFRRAEGVWSFNKFSIILCFLFVFCSASAPVRSQAQAKATVPADLIKHLEHDHFESINSLKQFPQSVKDYYKKKNGQDVQQIFAEPGKPFQSTCVRKQGGAPSQSFIVGAKSKNLCLLYYQIGGFALVDTAEVFELKGEHANNVWSSSMFRTHPENMNSLLAAVRERIQDKPVKK